MSEWNFYVCPDCGHEWAGNVAIGTDKCPKCKTEGKARE